MNAKGLLSMAAMAAMLWCGGCGDGLDDGARICGHAPDFVPKAFFVGQDLHDPGDDPLFWWRAMLLEAHGGLGITPGTAQPVERVAFEITDELLLARAVETGEPRAAFSILRHLGCGDSPPSSGLDPDTTNDLPWYERPYMQVDWSQNRLGVYGFDFASLAGHTEAAQYEEVGYYIGATHDDAPSLDLEAGTLDVTVRAYLGWSPVTLAGEELPGCALAAPGLLDTLDCQPAEMVVRHAFARLRERRIAQREWIGPMARAMGAQTVETVTETPLGPLQQSWLAQAPIWQRTHATQPCNADDEQACTAIGPGSRCDLRAHRCTLPFQLREPRPLLWYVVEDEPDADDVFFSAVADALASWDIALRAAIAAARYAECRQSGAGSCAEPVLRSPGSDLDDAIALSGELESCRIAASDSVCLDAIEEIAEARAYAPEVLALVRQPAMVSLCHSPVLAGDPPACGEQGTVARLGDLRFNVVHLSAFESAPALVEAAAIDPLTGERLSDLLTLSSQAIIEWATDAADLVRAAQGELDADDTTAAVNRYRAVDAARQAFGRGALAPLSSAEVRERMADLAGVSLASFDEVTHDAALAASLEQARVALTQTAGQAGGEPLVSNAIAERIERARGSAIEAALMTEPMRALTSVLGDEQAAHSPLRLNHPASARSRRHAHRLALAASNLCLLDDLAPPASILPAAGLLDEKFGPFDEGAPSEQAERVGRLHRFLLRRAYTWTVMHGLGHALGLSHNHAASADALHYRPQHWQLRTANGTITTPCADLDPEGGCVGPRYLDPPSSDERAGVIGMFMQASVMDEPGDATQLLLGIGAYDLAAVQALYGEVAAVYEDHRIGEPGAAILLSALDARPSLLSSSLHPSSLGRELGLLDSCEEVDAAHFEPRDLDGRFQRTLDAGLVTVAGETKRCRSPRVDYLPWSALESAPLDGDPVEAAADGQGRLRIPFLHGGDALADAGNPLVLRGDRGADAWEIADHLIAQEEASPPWLRDRHGHPRWTLAGALDAALERAERLRGLAHGVALLLRATRDAAAAHGASFDDAWALVVPGHESQLLAAGAAFDQLARLAARPSAGPHAWAQGGWLESTGSDPEAIVPSGASRYGAVVSFGGRTLWAPEGNSIGSYYDKAFATLLLLEPFGLVDDGASLEEAFGGSARRLTAEALAADPHLLGARLASDRFGAPLVLPDGSPREPVLWTRWWANALPLAPASTVPLDPVLDTELRRFVATWSLLYQPAAWDRLSSETLDGPHLELHAPDGRFFAAPTQGTETLLGSDVQRALAARLVQRANQLLAAAYLTTPGPDLDADGAPDWYLAVLDGGGQPIVLDPAIQCSALPDIACPCAGSPACVAFERHLALVAFVADAQTILATP